MSGLLAPGQLPGDNTVPAVVGLTPPIPYQQGNMKYYFLDTFAASILRSDGMKITFRNKIAKTDNKADHRYLDEQISIQAIPYLRYATEEEAHHHEMMINPVATIRQDVHNEVSSMLEEEKVKSADEARADVLKQLEDAGIEIPEHLMKTLAPKAKDRPQLDTDTGGRITPQNPGQTSAMAALERLKLGTASVVLTPPASAPFTPTGGGIGSTDDMGENQL